MPIFFTSSGAAEPGRAEEDWFQAQAEIAQQK